MNQKTLHNWTDHGGVRSFLRRAAECGVEISPVSRGKNLLKLSYKGTVMFLNGSRIPVMRRMGNLTTNKEVTKIILDDTGIRTPRGIVTDSFEKAVHLTEKNQMPFPLILKPTHGSRALGVTWNIQSKKGLLRAVSNYMEAKRRYKFEKDTFLVEEMFIGHEYRILVLDRKVISCVEKRPASVVGDGKSSIKKLIKAFNATRLPGFKIRIDTVVEKTLRDNDLTLESILANDHVLRLRNNLNMSDGGRSIEIPLDAVHPSFRDICTRATDISGLFFSGVDIIANDLSEMAKNDNYVVLELNPNPYYNMNEKPLVEGEGVDVSIILLKQLFSNITECQRASYP